MYWVIYGDHLLLEKIYFIRMLDLAILIVSGKENMELFDGESNYYGDDAFNQNLKRGDSSEGWISSVVDLIGFLVHFDGRGAKQDLIKSAFFDTMTTPSNLNPNYAKGLLLTLI